MSVIKKLNSIFFLLLIIFCNDARVARNRYASHVTSNGEDYFPMLISIPKCGTNLVKKLITTLRNDRKIIEPAGIYFLDNHSMHTFMTNNVFLASHALYCPFNVSYLTDKNIRIVFIYRDPRDQIVSTAFWLKKNYRAWPLYGKRPLEEIIDELIIGGGPVWESVFSDALTWRSLHGIDSFYELFLPWRFHPNVYVTTFEKLVGPKGGGAREEQLHEIQAIAYHLGIELSEKDAKRVTEKLFGGTETFREGKIGSWKKHFLERHKLAFKKVGLPLLKSLGYTW